jgi:hypothetical protein
MLLDLYDTLGTWRKVAEHIGGVSPALCWKVANMETRSKKIERALGLRPKRIRLAASVTEEQRAALQRFVARMGHTSWSDYCQAVADEKLSFEQRLKEVRNANAR